MSEFKTIIHRHDGQTEEYIERGDTPQSREVIEERLAWFPSGQREFWQHTDGVLYEQPEGGA